METIRYHVRKGFSAHLAKQLLEVFGVESFVTPITTGHDRLEFDVRVENALKLRSYVSGYFAAIEQAEKLAQK